MLFAERKPSDVASSSDSRVQEGSSKQQESTYAGKQIIRIYVGVAIELRFARLYRNQESYSRGLYFSIIQEISILFILSK